MDVLYWTELMGIYNKLFDFNSILINENLILKFGTLPGEYRSDILYDGEKEVTFFLNFELN